MRVPNGAHSSRPWRIHELIRDFRLEDVWALPTPGGPEDFPRLVQLAASLDPSNSSSTATRTLFDIRWKLGDLFGWDRPGTGIGSSLPGSASYGVTSCVCFMKENMRKGYGFTSIYVLNVF